jgi:hypothetical protein
MSTTFGRLALNGSPKSEFDKLAFLRAACSNIPASLASIDFYYYQLLLIKHSLESFKPNIQVRMDLQLQHLVKKKIRLDV